MVIVVEHQRAVSLLFAVLGFVGAIFVYDLYAQVAAVASINDPVLGGVAPVSAIVAVAAGVATFFILLRNERSATFFDSVVDEIVKIHWPSREETVSNTSVVAGAAVFFMSLLAFYDLVWGRATSLLLFSGH